jgi:DNA repair protein RecO (recombination protein O)
LQFIKEYQWSYLYEKVLFNVVHHAVAMYVIELLQHGLKQPEANPELFYLIETTLKALDTGSDTLVANIPVYFMLHLGSELGFQIQGEYSVATPVLDLQEGFFVEDIPLHPHYIMNEPARLTSQILNINSYHALEHIFLNRTMRRELLQAYQQYLALHISDFGEIRSLPILQEVLN